MTFINRENVGGTDFAIQGTIPMGTCATPAGTEVKAAAFADSFELGAGNLISVTFTYANTYGNGTTTYPKLTVNGTNYPIVFPTGEYAGNGAWVNGQAITFMYDGTNLIMTNVPKIQTTDQVTNGSALPVTSGGVYAKLAQYNKYKSVWSSSSTLNHSLVLHVPFTGFGGKTQFLINTNMGECVILSVATNQGYIITPVLVRLNNSLLINKSSGNSEIVKKIAYQNTFTYELDADGYSYNICIPCGNYVYASIGQIGGSPVDFTVQQVANESAPVYARVSNAVIELPLPPVTDGTYSLQCTVASGVATYSWT